MDEQPPTPVPTQPQQPVEQAAWVPATPGSTQPPVPTTVPKKGMPLFLKIMIGCGALVFILPILFVILIVAINPAEKLEQAKKELEKTATSSATQVEKDKTADWKTFVSKNWGFEVKYPNNWLEEYDKEDYAYISEIGGAGGITIIFYFDEQDPKIKTDYQKLENYKVGETRTDNSYVTTRIADTTLNGYKTTRYNQKWENENGIEGAYLYFFIKDNKVHAIEITYGKGQEDLKLFERIFSTFKFL